MSETLALFQHVTPANPPQWRSLYGNLHGIGGTPRSDVKCYKQTELHAPFHSTEDRSFPVFRQALHALFPEPSPYESR